jgi:hypothetical protein
MAIDFPASPTLNDVFTVGNVTYVWDGTKWTASVTGGISLDKIEEGNTSAEVIDTGSDGRFVVTTEGTERLFVNSNGNISVGSSLNDSVGSTTTLTVDQTSGNGQISLGANGTVRGRIFADNSTGELRIGNPTAGDLMLYTNNTERLRINSAGLVGIGTSSPSVSLHVVGGGMFASSTTGGSIVQARNSDFSSLGYFGVEGSTGGVTLTGTLANSTFISSGASGTPLQFGTGGVIRSTLTSTGLGIGTSSPGSPLEVQASSNGGNIANDGIRVYAANRSQYANFGYNGLNATNTLEFGIANSVKMKLDSSGNVGIGTTSPSQLLHLSVSSGVNYIRTSNGTVDYYNGINSSNEIYIGSTTIHPITFRIGDSEKTRIDTSGRLLVGTSTSNSNTNSKFQIADTSGNVTTTSYSANNSNAGYYYFFKTRGTSVDSHTVLQSGDGIANLFFAGSDGTTYRGAASIEAVADGGWSSGDAPGRLVFSTTADGASGPTERMRITSDYAQFAPNSANEVKLYLGGSGAQMQYDSANGHIKFITNAGVRNLFLYNGQGTEFRSQSAIFPTTDNAVTCGTGGNRWSAVYAANGTIQTSDSRQKCEIQQSILGTDFIKSLKPVSYRWIEGGKSPIVKDVDENGNIYVTDENGDWVYESKIGQRTHWGFIAQEVKEAVDAAGVDFGGWVLTDKDDPDSQQALRYDQFIAPLTKALQEAMERIETLEGMVAVNNITIDEQQHQLSTLAARLTALENA